MAVVAFTSAKGAPGVTVTALAATLRWPRPVLLVEADVAGGSSILAGYLRGQVPHSRSLLGLSMALRSGRLRGACGTRPCPRRGPLARPGPRTAPGRRPTWSRCGRRWPAS